jgi:hypothetical protein
MRYLEQAALLKLDAGKRYYGTVIPQNPVINQFPVTHQARMGDRWDTLAYKYLGNAALWYLLSNANDVVNGSIFIKPGTIVVIPEV